MRVKYADFSSGSVEAAVQTAIASEGFDPATVGEMAVDESGNTFQEGTVDVGGHHVPLARVRHHALERLRHQRACRTPPCTWASACTPRRPLSHLDYPL